MPLVELAYEILKERKEPLYFREIMRQIQELRGMTDEEVNEVIARLYTEINIDGRFTCIGQNIWGLIRWYPVDKVGGSSGNKKFVRRSGDAFSDEDEEDVYEDEEEVLEEVEEDGDLFDTVVEDGEDEVLPDDDLDDTEEVEDEVEEPFEEEPLLEDDEDEEDEED